MRAVWKGIEIQWVRLEIRVCTVWIVFGAICFRRAPEK
jgi:hypothetical protein